MPREINAAGYKLIKEFEAGPGGNSRPALVPYYCPAGKLTNGWGNTFNVQPGVVITLTQAEADLARNLDWAEDCVDSACRGANDNEFAAMVSLCFNIGAAGFKGSTVARLFNKGDRTGSAAAFSMWRKMTDPQTGHLVDSPGLIRRRGVEAALFLTPVAEPVGTVHPATIEATPAMPQIVAAERPAIASKTVIAGGVAVATGAGSVADQLNQSAPLLDSVSTMAASVQGMMRLGGVALSVVALAAGAYMLWRYIQKRRRGEVLST